MTNTSSIIHIDAILYTILEACDNTTLARLARTAHFISKPALNVLWRNLERISDILGTFPSELITWQSTQPNSWPTVTRLIVPRDWTRFVEYARCVRSWGPEDLSYISEPLVDHIAFGRLPGYILPNLTHMKVTGSSVSGIHLSTLLLCSSLESVSVRNVSPDPQTTRSMFTFFRTLADRSLDLKEFSVEWGVGPITNPLFKDGIADVLMQKPSSLTSVKLWTPNCIDIKGFTCLSQLPHLQTLHLNLIDVENTHHLIPGMKENTRAFASLRNLHLAGEPEAFHKILECFNYTPKMTYLGFCVREYPRSLDLLQLFATVSSKFPSLQTLQFINSKEEMPTPRRDQYLHNELYHHDFHIIAPLLQISSLEAVHLELGFPLRLTDIELESLGTSWPRIRILNLCPNPYTTPFGNSQPSATIFGLIRLARSCPNLQHLGIFADCIMGVPDNLIVAEDVASRVLSRIDVGRSRVVEPARIAALLSGAFPGLKVFQWTGMGATSSMSVGVGAGSEVGAGTGIGIETGIGGVDMWEFAPGWKQVYELLPIFKAVRANERKIIEGY